MNIKSFRNRVLKASISVALLSLLIWIANPASLLESLAQVSLYEFFVLMLLSFLMIGLSALKWQLFIESLGAKVFFSRLYALYLTGYFINIIFPSYIGGDALRSYYVGKKVGQKQSLSATFLERYTGLLAMASLGLIAAIYESRLLGSATRLVVIGFGIAVILATVAAFYLRIDADKYSNKFLRKLCSKASQLHELMLATSNQPSLWLKALLISFLYHLLTVANTYVAAVAIGWSEPPVAQLFVVLPIILVLGALPITPSGLGIQEGAFFHFLQMLGASAPQALGVAVVLRAKTYLLALIGWFFWIRIGTKEKAALSADSNEIITD